MHFIAWNRAISLFPRSTFMNRVSFVASQEEVHGDTSGRLFQKWFFAYAKMRKIRLVGLDHRRYEFAELGKRYIGDRRCWIIPYIGEGTPPYLRRSCFKIQHFAWSPFRGIRLDVIHDTSRLVHSYRRTRGVEVSADPLSSLLSFALIEIDSIFNGFRSIGRTTHSHWSSIRFSTYHEHNN
ncbi:hypothetical protein CVT26_001426 [Gymnopilus dilepis]|uniref:Uncharacterized protein n=1 Tax=Gymnopilus dilepis TaxID=231916 RepID=A0A409W7J7_9AGAR|nr:hypothetical protein CVT26_001426 [Gymnopilus dilepis]